MDQENQDTGKTNAEALGESTKVAQEAAKMIGGEFEQGKMDSQGNISGGFKKVETKTTQEVPADEPEPENRSTKIINDLFEVQRKKAQNKIDRLRDDYETSSPILKARVDEIEMLYGAKIEEMKAFNDRVLKGTENNLLRTGVARYAPMRQQAIMTSEEEEGFNRIQKLKTEKLMMIHQAEAAEQEQDMRSLQSAMDKLDELDIKESQTLAELKISIEESAEKQRAEQKKIEQRLSQETQVLALVSSGIEDATSLYVELNFNDDGTIVDNPISVEDIMDVKNAAFPEEKLTGDLKELEDAKKAGLLPQFIAALPMDQQLPAYIRMKAQARKIESVNPENEVMERDPIPLDEFTTLYRGEYGWVTNNEHVKAIYNSYLEEFNKEVLTDLGWTKSQKRKLAAAGLLGAPIQEQADFLTKPSSLNFSIDSEVIQSVLNEE